MHAQTRLAFGLIVLLTITLSAPAVRAADAPSPQIQASPTTLQQDQQKLQEDEDETTSLQQRITVVQTSLQQIADKQGELNGQVAALQQQSARLLPQLQAKAVEYQRRQKSLMDAIDADYKTPTPNGLFLAVESGSISNTLNKSAYAASFETKISRLAEAAATARDDLDARKRQVDGQKSSLEVLQREQDQLKAGADGQQAQLKEMLDNRTNETAYLAAKVATAKAQQENLLKALNTAGSAGGALWDTYSDGAGVKQGDVIGLEGSTGNSTGCHTHFSVIKDGNWIDPTPFFTANLLRQPDGEISQLFGMTAHALTGAYNGHIHNGVDFVQPCGAPVHAAADGVVIRDNRTDGSGFGHYLMIRHSNGLITLYGHLI